MPLILGLKKIYAKFEMKCELKDVQIIKYILTRVSRMVKADLVALPWLLPQYHPGLPGSGWQRCWPPSAYSACWLKQNSNSMAANRKNHLITNYSSMVKPN